MPVVAPQDIIEHVEVLVAQHRELEDEPLLLAVYYEPPRDPGDIFVFEVIEGFGADTVDEEQKLFEVTYGSTASLPLRPHQRLHLVLTNPIEFEVACRDKWPLLEEVRQAVRQDRALPIYSHPDRPDLEAKLRG